MKLDPVRRAWMGADETRAVMAALAKDGGAARFVGGAVRDALLQRPVTDVDIATPLTPDEVTRRLQAAGVGAVPTGIEHGTITAVANGKPFEITTLRRDVSTDGRRATVAFTQDWREDAARRDFTMNALYASASGEVFDYFGGVPDLRAGRVRFVGDPVSRIREDYLRILRLFRFHAWYGKGAVNTEALDAAIAEKAGLAKLSGERIQKELLKLLGAEDPVAALEIMADAGILSEILPCRSDLPRLKNLTAIDRGNGFEPDPILRLTAVLPGDSAAAGQVSAKLKLSNADRDRLRDLAMARDNFTADLRLQDLRKALYEWGKRGVSDRLKLRWAESFEDTDPKQWRALMEEVAAWRRPVFPLTGHDIVAAGVPEGPLVGKILSELEQSWIESDFADETFILSKRLKRLVQAEAREKG